MPTVVIRVCGNCKHFEADQKGEIVFGDGVCRRNAPTPINALYGNDLPRAKTVWPPVYTRDSCGEWDQQPSPPPVETA
jgi:hypothetical protein